MLVIREYVAEQESSWLLELWNGTFDQSWTLSAEELRGHLLSASILLVAELNGRRLGFIAAGSRTIGTAAILAVVVEKRSQRRGIGSALLRRVETVLRQAGVTECSIGNDGLAEYFWPGTPPRSEAWPFFSKHGWRQRDSCADLLLMLDEYESPAWVSARLANAGVHLELATLQTEAELRAFEQEHFPAWFSYYANALSRKQYENVLLALKADGRVIGSVMLTGSGSVSWQSELGTRCGALNVLGVAHSEQGQGIGMALADRAATLLRDRGCVSCLIGETGLQKWYGKLGAKVWSDYRLACKNLGLCDVTDPHTLKIEAAHVC